VNGDKNRFKHVILNLLDNAYKYTPSEKCIGIFAKRVEDQIVIGIEDFGPGINKEDQESLFDKFYRGKDGISKKTRGSGLGLFIAKSIVEAHKGKIWVESELGKGAKFIFSIPKSVVPKVA
jgi:signal transduction histidine kinase